MLSDKSTITGARWAITKEDFLQRFNKASTQLDKKEVLDLLFNIDSPTYTQWQPLTLFQNPQDKDSLILKYTICNVIPLATLEDLHKVELGPLHEKEMILSGFHEYEYATLPTLQLFPLDLQSYWVNQNYLVVQVNKNQKQLEQYFSQVVRKGVKSQEAFAQYLNNFFKKHGHQLSMGFALRFRDQATKEQNPAYNLKTSFFSPQKSFEHEGELHEAFKEIVRQKATYGADNSLATPIKIHN